MNTIPLILILLSQSGYAGSPLPVIDLALSVAGVRSDDVVYDIGSGDGRVVCLAAKKYGCKAVGIELDANLVNLSRMATIRNGVQNRVTIRHENALTADLSDATVIYLYHQTEFLDKLWSRLESLRKGTRIICLDYTPSCVALGNPIKTIEVGGHEHKIYMCTIEDKESPLVSAARLYSGVEFYNGKREALLVDLAQQTVDTLASQNMHKYWPGRGGDGHPDWDRKRIIISNKFGMKGVEVTAISWPYKSEKITAEITRGLFYDWQRSAGHWNVISKQHEIYGDAVARSNSGIWYGCIIVAD